MTKILKTNFHFEHVQVPVLHIFIIFLMQQIRPKSSELTTQELSPFMVFNLIYSAFFFFFIFSSSFVSFISSVCLSIDGTLTFKSFLNNYISDVTVAFERNWIESKQRDARWMNQVENQTEIHLHSFELKIPMIDVDNNAALLFALFIHEKWNE